MDNEVKDKFPAIKNRRPLIFAIILKSWNHTSTSWIAVSQAAPLAMFAFSAMALLHAAAAAQCPQWDATGIYSIKQSNNIVVRVGLNQRGPRLSGNAFFQGKSREEHGTVSAIFQGDAFKMEIKWDYGETGVYVGKRIEEKAPAGKLSYLVGEAYIKEQPDNRSRRTTWRGSNALHCYQGR